MALLAFNLTTSPVTLAAGNPAKILPASSLAGRRGAAVNVTSELRNLSGVQYTALEAQRPNTVAYMWIDAVEYTTPGLTVDISPHGDQDNVVVNISTTGDDAATGGANDPVLTHARATALTEGWYRQKTKVKHVPGTYVIPPGMQFAVSAPIGGSATPSREMLFEGAFTDELGTRTCSAGTTNRTLIDASLTTQIRSGTGASVSSVSGGGTIAGLMTVIDMTGLVPADVGRTFRFASSVNPGNIGPLTMHQFISATSAVFRNPRGVVEAGTIEWQETFAGDTISFLDTTPTVALRGIRRNVDEQGISATGNVKTVAGASLVDGETVTISDGTLSKIFEFDSGGGVTPGNVAVAFTALDSAATVATSLAAAITGSGLFMRAGRTVNSNGDPIVFLENLRLGAAGNVAITDTVVNAGFTVSGMSGGLGTGTTAFHLTAALPAVPAVGDQFVVEKPSVIWEVSGALDFIGGAHTYFSMLGIKIKLTNAAAFLHMQGAQQLLAEGVEIDFGGVVPTSLPQHFFQDILAGVRGQGVAGVNSLGNVGIHMHDGIWQVGGDDARVTNVFVTRNMQVNVVRSELNFANSACFHTSINSQEHGELNITNTIFDGPVFTADAAIITVDVGSDLRSLNGAVVKGGTRGVRFRNGSQGTLAGVLGYFNTRAGVQADLRSGCTIDVGGTAQLGGNLGDTELSHTTAGAFFDYGTVAGAASGTIRFVDANGVKGQGDAYGNRIDAA